ncbi:ATP-dependent DNA helicase DinG [Desulfonispora thiosulfatigenes DSM 11270]|uniref:3'-5' exonuclease DinG n=1 Tax=Desulfonispora thiosulfatigenes DSM 11270 TaxID=656914 RepID=A0A1W1VNE7_DESTI|nr:helicase C-terminal domain-containing protein [Desulfonispora thiosulfatigenes]SMB94591.1 ATP-dependent DNA helicase DinG [Desulfonispora thiosulfatigenes DSM 11270]
MKNFSFVALDLETTGLDESAEIIEIGLVKFIDGEITDKYQTLLKPSKPISKEIEELTGITNEMLKDKPKWAMIEHDVLDFIGQDFLVAHNASFDSGFISRVTDKLIEKIWVDTYQLAKIALPTIPNYKLADIAQFFNLKIEKYHRAANDAEMAGKILLNLAKTLFKYSPFLIQENIELLQNTNDGLTYILKNVQTKIISKFSYDENIHQGQEQNYSNTALNIKEGSETLKPGGIISSCYNNYEYRVEQVNMLKVVDKAFLENKHAIIEAGTGIGKSMAYLIPALIWAQKKEKKVIIATHTIALQEQLFKKEVPFLEKCFEVKLPVAIIKGRNNYICKRRFEKIKVLKKTESKENIFLIQINNWLSETKYGDKEELNLKKYENEYWHQISSQSETCLARKCPFFYKECLYMKNKRHSEKSNIIITNHALLLQDAKINNKLLPEYDYAIIDEAHNLEEEATEQFATKVDLLKVIKLCNQLCKGKNIGIIDRINFQITSSDNLGNFDLVKENIQIIKDETQILKSKVLEIKELFFNSRISNFDETRITQKERMSPEWICFLEQLDELKNFITSLKVKLVKVISYLDSIEKLEDYNKEMDFIVKIISENIETLNIFLEGKNPNYVYWIASNKGNNFQNLIIFTAPIEIGSILSKNLFNDKKSIVLTSATLSVAGSFDYTIKSLGLKGYDILQFTANSPFNYKNKSLICIPSDIPDPTLTSEDNYTKEIINNIKTILKVAKGGVLILLTSNKMLNKIYYALKKDSNLKDKNILTPGIDGSRTTVIKQLKDNISTVVLGVNSFWEGIDVKGDALTTVIIVKLPFVPPTRPVVAARLDKLKENGEMGFFVYSLPKAILKFRQGYGRLIRDKNDWGALIILDQRIISKNYGKQFLSSLPSQRIIQDTSKKVYNSLEKWVNN